MARGFPYRLKIAEIGKHSANMIKLTCHGTGSRIVTMLYPFQLAHLTSPTMSPFQVLLHIRAFTAWMVAVFFSEFLDAFVKIHKRLAAFLLRTEHLMLEFATFVLLQITQAHPQTHEFLKSPNSHWKACSYPSRALHKVSICASSCHADSLASHCAKEWSSVTRAVS